MTKNKQTIKHKIEYILLSAILLGILINGLVHKDSTAAIISAVCGITYTFIAGKGNPICYIFGVTGSSFYSYLAFQNALWGNLILYLAYYIPMQVIGFFKWNKHLKTGEQNIIKIELQTKEKKLLSIAIVIFSSIMITILYNSNSTHPILDSLTTILSVGGMYLTVRRAIEQWIIWALVNTLSLVMWVQVALTGVRVYSTIAMWAIYLFLAIYFYDKWKKEMFFNKK